MPGRPVGRPRPVSTVSWCVAGGGCSFPADDLIEGVGGVGLEGLASTRSPGVAEQAVDGGLQGGHDLGADLGVVAVAQVEHTLHIGPRLEAALGMHPPAPRLGIRVSGGAGAGALIAQLRQRRRLGRLDQALLGRGIGGGGVGHRRGLLG